MSVKVSVIVPVYNAGKYLDRCLTSLVSQTLKNIELVIIDDGSTDNSREIIDRFSALYPGNIVSVKQENKGIGETRNTGVRRARGRYIGFVDSDDWVEPDMFKLLYETAIENNSDVVICDINKMDETDSGCIFSEVWHGSGRDNGSVADFIISGVLPSAWNKLYRRDLALRIPYPDMRCAEDLATTPVILSYSKKISYIPEPLYNYLKRKGSLTDSINHSNRNDFIIAWERCLSDCNPEYIKEMEYAIYIFITNILLERLVSGCSNDLDDILAVILKYKENFSQNTFIVNKIADKPLLDFIGVTDTTEAASNPFAQTLANLLEETMPLMEQLGDLPQAMLLELHDMYDDAMKMIAENADAAYLKFLLRLYDRRGRIKAVCEKRQ